MKLQRKQLCRTLLLQTSAVSAVILLLPDDANGQVNSTINSGNWYNPAIWSAGNVPHQANNQTDVRIQTGHNVTISSGPASVAGVIDIGRDGTSTNPGFLTIEGVGTSFTAASNDNSGSHDVGNGGSAKGRLDINGGNVLFNNRVFQLGVGAANLGIYRQNGGIAIFGNQFRSGVNGTGSALLTDGLMATGIGGDLFLGLNTGSFGVFGMSGGTLVINDSITVGNLGAGLLNIVGGRVFVRGLDGNDEDTLPENNRDLRCALRAGSIGSITIGGDAFIDVDEIVVSQGSGTNNQSDADATRRAIGVVTVAGGSVLARNLDIGSQDDTSGTYNQTGGHVVLNGDVLMANQGFVIQHTFVPTIGNPQTRFAAVFGASEGFFNMSGGTLDVGSSVADRRTGITSPDGVFADSTRVYWSTPGALKRCNLTNGNPVARPDGMGGTVTDFLLVDLGGLADPQGIWVNDLNDLIYWADAGTQKIQRADIIHVGLNETYAENVTDLVSGLSSPFGIHVTDTFVYWTDNGTDKIQRANLDGTNVTDLVATGPNPFGISVDDSFIYWIDRDLKKIQRANLDGSNVIDLVTGLTDPVDLFFDDGFLYWTDSGAEKIQRADLDGSNVTDLVAEDLKFSRRPDTPHGIFVDSAFVYWTDNASKIQFYEIDNLVEFQFFDDFIVGERGSATAVIGGDAELNIYEDLVIGRLVDVVGTDSTGFGIGNGSVRIENDARVNVRRNIAVGFSGMGNLTITGPASPLVTVDGSVYIPENPGGNGHLTLEGGTLHVKTAVQIGTIGAAAATLTQTGGALYPDGELTTNILEDFDGTADAFRFSGGTISHADLATGGTGDLQVTGDLVMTDQATLAVSGGLHQINPDPGDLFSGPIGATIPGVTALVTEGFRSIDAAPSPPEAPEGTGPDFSGGGAIDFTAMNGGTGYAFPDSIPGIVQSGAVWFLQVLEPDGFLGGDDIRFGSGHLDNIDIRGLANLGGAVRLTEQEFETMMGPGLDFDPTFQSYYALVNGDGTLAPQNPNFNKQGLDVGIRWAISPFSYVDWAATTIPFGLDRSFTGDADGDDRTNGLEYVTGTNPDFADPIGNNREVRITVAPGSFTFETGIDERSAVDTIWRLLRSTDLVLFTELFRREGAVETLAPNVQAIYTTRSDPAADTLRIIDSAPMADGAFYIFEIEYQNP